VLKTLRRKREVAGWFSGASGRLIARAALFPLLTVALVAAVLLNVGLGAVGIGPLEVVAILAGGAGLDLGVPYTEQQAAVLWGIRLPRVALGALVGGGLAVAGAALQGIFRNPLAEPGIIGVSSGAALGAVAAIVFGIAAFGGLALPFFAFGGGLLATLTVYAFARHGGRTEVVTLILTGIAVNAVAGAGTGLLTTMATDAQLRNIVFWTLGSLGGATWPAVLTVLPFVGAGAFLAARRGRELNLMVLGESEAQHLGVSTERVRLALIALAALITGAAVSVSGIIGFVGLVVPHLIRLLSGPDHRTLLPASVLGGAALLLLADLAARTLVIPAELPLGVVTAFVGGPFFLWLLHRTRKQHGGWG
jgi:iron complex transport system permease protein